MFGILIYAYIPYATVPYVNATGDCWTRQPKAVCVWTEQPKKV